MGIFSFLKKGKSNKRLAILDVSDATFKQQVIQRSYKMPVVVDYWAAWCGPCRHLGPVLEKIAEEPERDFILAKLDTERNRKTASQYNIYSIPAVKAFRNGQIIDEFTGAIPETLVRRFITKVEEADAPPPQIKGSPNGPQRLKQARQHLMKGRGFEAFVLLDSFPDAAGKEEADQLMPLARFIFDMNDGDGLTGLAELDKAYEAAARNLNRGKFDQALQELKTALEAGEEIDDEYTMTVINSIFNLLGENHRTTREYQKDFELFEAN